ncbi:hypothetical protein M405DRAFT_821564 [Rhizopogon salebrosus TDB-379]|nr:hypothetical protein M405DRAFT_821564 [Rhizopogon salebrosus TDB-379]
MSDSVDDIPVATNNDPNASRPFADQESKPEGSADGFDVVPQDKEDAVESIQQGDAAGEIEITPSSVFSSQDAEPDATEAQDAAHGLPPSRQALDSDSGDSDKGLKRKLADRATSQGPENPVPLTSAESAKRPRDDTDKDDNPREQKRPSPPPEQQPATAETSTPKFGGFMAYASAASPFAAVKGQNIFSGASSSSSKKLSVSPSPSPSPPLTSNTLAPSPFAGFASSQWSTQQMPASMATKRTGFEAFIGSASPFATAGASTFPSRPKSPLRNAGGKTALERSRSPPRRTPLSKSSAFSPYASGVVHSFFAAPRPKRARADSPNGGSSRSSLERTSSTGVHVFGSGWNESGDGSGSGEEDYNEDDEDDEQVNGRPPSTFGERLRAGRDEEEDEPEEEKEKDRLQEQEVVTGEEDEETIHHVRAKLYTLCSQSQWKERGTGLLKLNVRRSDGGGARLLMRKEAVYTVILNVKLFPGMRCSLAQDPRYIRFSVIEDGATTHYNLRVSNAKIAQELLEEIQSNIPL